MAVIKQLNEQNSIVRPKIVILNDVGGWVIASVEIDGKEYEVTLNTIGMPIAKRNELIREMAVKQAKAGE